MENLSLIVPSYNSARYLSDLVNSIFGGITSLGLFEPQTLLPDQVIIFDDCSIDNTEEVVFELSKLNSRIQYFKADKNQGTAISCNEAIKKTVSRFITRIDADDMRETWSIESLMKKLVKNPESYVYDDVMIFFKGHRKDKVWKMPEYSFYTILEQNTNHAGVMFARKSWESCGGYPPNFSDGRDDWAFNVALGAVGCCGIHVEGAGYLYRREQQNRTVQNATSEKQIYYKRKMFQTFKDLYSGRFGMACCGNRERKSSAKSSPASSSLLVGATGMTLLHYNGSNFGAETYFGPVTGVAYKFSASASVKNVDNRDLHTAKFTGLLDLNDHGKPVFSVHTVPVEAPVIEAKIIEVKQVESEPVKDEPVVEEEPLGTMIEEGQFEDVSADMIQKLAGAGITTWEAFVNEASESLSDITSKSMDFIEELKKRLTAE